MRLGAGDAAMRWGERGRLDVQWVVVVVEDDQPHQSVGSSTSTSDAGLTLNAPGRGTARASAVLGTPEEVLLPSRQAERTEELRLQLLQCE